MLEFGKLEIVEKTFTREPGAVRGQAYEGIKFRRYESNKGKKAAEEAQVSTLAEQTANHLVAVGATPAEKRAAVVTMLNNPVQTLNLMSKLASLYKKAKDELAKAAAHVPADGSTASFRDAGVEASAAPIKESDKAYMRGLGINV